MYVYIMGLLVQFVKSFAYETKILDHSPTSHNYKAIITSL